MAHAVEPHQIEHWETLRALTNVLARSGLFDVQPTTGSPRALHDQSRRRFAACGDFAKTSVDYSMCHITAPPL